MSAALGRREVLAAALALGLVRFAPGGARGRAQRGEDAATRADFLRSWMRLEDELARGPRAPSTAPALHRGFDAALAPYLGGDASAALRALDALRCDLVHGERNRAAARLLSALRLDARPAVGVGADALEVRLTRLYEPLAGAAEEAGARVLLVRPDGSHVASADVTVAAGSREDLRVSLPLAALPAGAGTCELQLADRYGPHWRGLWSHAPRSFDEQRRALASGVRALELDERRRADARVLLARSRLLTDLPPAGGGSSFLVDRAALAAELARELDALREERPPYRARAGTLWRTVEHEGRALPLVLHVPGAVADGAPLPLVVALHDAGFDERLLTAVHGRGRLLALAERRGFVLALARTETLLRGERRFDALLAALARDLPLDRERVFVLGHGLGALVAARLARRRPAAVARAACLAGAAELDGGAECAPTLVVSGELDPFATPDALRATVARARARGRRVELRAVEDVGHGLLVLLALRPTLDWFGLGE